MIQEISKIINSQEISQIIVVNHLHTFDYESRYEFRYFDILEFKRKSFNGPYFHL